MTGKQMLNATKDMDLKNHIEAAPRKPESMQITENINLKINKESGMQKHYTNTNSKLISLVGGVIIGIIIYKLLINYSGWF